ncbi:MAG: CHRD domain-containing protein [Anaerolineae bacterium]|nr:CHRD domain-containing protein [Anaerolineae bacterium]
MIKRLFITAFLLSGICLAACRQQESATPIPAPGQVTATSSALNANATPHATAHQNPASVTAPEPATLNPAQGQEIGSVFQAFLSPHQEPGEEKDTPALIPQQFRSTEPSLLRSERLSHGHGMLRFTHDLSKVYVDVQLENVNPEDVIMFHIHCGKPDQLGPILIDFAHAGDMQENLADGLFSVVLTNEDIEMVLASQHGLIGGYTLGCPIVPGVPGEVKTIAGMEHIARQGELYFNLHTRAQTYFGDIRGQVRPVGE